MTRITIEPTERDVLAEIIEKHEYIGSYYQCACTLDIDVRDVETIDRHEWALHLADAILADGRVGVVGLPEADGPGRWNTLGKFDVELTGDERHPIRYGGEILTNATVGQSTAAALLAAAWEVGAGE